MGDLIGEIVGGTLYSVPLAEISRIADSNLATSEKTALYASMNRINALFMIARAGSGHIGSSFSSMEIMSYLYTNEVYPHCKPGSKNSSEEKKAIFFSSKGHDAPAMYSVLIGLGILQYDLLDKLRQLDGLPGHPDVGTPGIATNTGSLGMGVSKAKGFIKANRLQNKDQSVFVLTGDGELQEGQFWESLGSAVNHAMDELTVIIDHNKLQSDTLVAKVNDLGDLEAKLHAFGWHVERCDGNEVDEFAECLARCKAVQGKPKVIIADTVKGKGVSFMEHTSIDSDVENYKFHSGAPSAENYRLAVDELLQTVNNKLQAAGLDLLALNATQAPSAPQASGRMQRLIPTYANELVSLADRHSNIVALDADLVLDTGLIPFSQQHSDRFIECGIAEQDMVSQAGALALAGMMPIAHSFACFLAARPREQIYNNSSEGTKIIYVGSLAGVLPGGPGHSHQGVSDIGAIGHIPGMKVLVPGCEEDVAPLLAWAVNSNEESSYIRLESIPVALDFEYVPNTVMKLGYGTPITEKATIKVITYGPTMLAVALDAAKQVQGQVGEKVEVINFPWANFVDPEWLGHISGSAEFLLCLENHLAKGGLGDRIAACIAALSQSKPQLLTMGLERVPVGGRNDEVLQYHGLDAAAVSNRILEFINGRQNDR